MPCDGRSKTEKREQEEDDEVEIIEVLTVRSKRVKSSTLYGYGFGSSTLNSLHPTKTLPSLPPLPPVPAWGRLIDEQSTAKVALQRFLGFSPPLLRHAYTACYRGVFNDRFNAVPGMGIASIFGRYGSGVRSILNVSGCSTSSSRSVEDAEGLVRDQGRSGGQAILNPEVIQDVEGEEDDDVLSLPNGNAQGAKFWDKSHRNFKFILNWALESCEVLKSCRQDVQDLQKLRVGLSPEAATLLWQCFHSPRAICRVHVQREGKKTIVKGKSSDRNDTGALEELVKQQVVRDVTGDQGALLMHLYDVFAALRADEMARMTLCLFGSAAAATSAASSSLSCSWRGRRNASREASLKSLSTFLERCQKEGSPERVRRKLGHDLVKWLAKETQAPLQVRGEQQQQQSFRLVCLAPRLAKLLQRLFALFFMTNGYDAEDAVVLWWNDLETLRFAGRGDVDGAGQGRRGEGLLPLASPGPSTSTESSADDEDQEAEATIQKTERPPRSELPVAWPGLGSPEIPCAYIQFADTTLSLSDAFEAAVASGDSATAYACLHTVSDLFLPRPMRPAHASGSVVSDPGCTSLAALEVTQVNTGTHRFRLDVPAEYRGLEELPGILFKVLARVMGRGIGLLERDRKHAQAVHYLKIILDGSEPLPWSLRGHFHSRLVLDLVHCNRPGEALAACELALADPRVDGEDRLFLQAKCLSLAVAPRRWKKPAFPALQTAPELELKMAEVQGWRQKGKSLEDSVLACLLQREGGGMAGRERCFPGIREEDPQQAGHWRGAHWENGLMLSLFGVLCWDVLWSAQPAHSENESIVEMSSQGANGGRPDCRTRSSPGTRSTQSCRYQHAPCDLQHNRGFLKSCPGRVSALEQVLARIQRGESGALLAENHARYHGTICLGIDWTTFSLPVLQTVAEALGSSALMLLCETLIRDYSLLSHGFPDLLLWRDAGPHGGMPAMVRFVEVKGPGDSLSWAQKYWIDKLVRVGVRVEVARVVEGNERGFRPGAQRRKA